MFVCLGDVYGEVCGVFDVVVAEGGQAHKVGTAAFAFYHVGDGFFIQVVLGQDADHQGSLLDEGDGSVLQLSCCIGLCMYIADFLHFQTAFHTDGIVNASADEKGILCIGLFGCKPLDPLSVILQDLADLVRDGL